jgi:hypothetical protein
VETEHKGPALRKLFYSIGEVSDLTGVPPHVLRYWETEFRQLWEQRFTIKGAKIRLRSKRDPNLNDRPEIIGEVRKELKEILDILESPSGRGAVR